MALFPFKNKEYQNTWGLILTLFGLMVLALGINNANLTALGLKYTIIGFWSSFLGMVYFVDSLASG